MRALFLILWLSAAASHAQWESVGGGVSNGQVTWLEWDTEDECLYVLGSMRWAGPDDLEVNGVTYWKDGLWHLMDGGVDHPFNGAVPFVHQTIKYGGEHIVVGGFDSIGGNELASRVARWTGNSWLPLDPIVAHDGNTYGLSVIDDELHLHGGFDTIADVPVQNWAIWNGQEWRAGDTMGVFLDWSTREAIKFEDRIYVGGNFETSDGRNDLLMKVGDEWVELGPGLQGDCYVSDLEVYDGLLWVTGYFFSGAGNAATGVMAWDGEQWLDPFPQMELYGWGRSLTIANGKLYICGFMTAEGLPGTYQIAEYDGEQLCIRGGNQIVTTKVDASPDTLYAITCDQIGCNEFGGLVVNHLMKMPLSWPADTCYAVVQGVAEQKASGKWAAFPNPAQTTITLKGPSHFSGTCWLSITDQTGRLVTSRRLVPTNGTISLNVDDLAPGNYAARMTYDGGKAGGSTAFVVVP